jgi:hypothetical protein
MELPFQLQNILDRIQLKKGISLKILSIYHTGEQLSYILNQHALD